MQTDYDYFFEFLQQGRIVARHEIDEAAFDPAFQAAHLLGMKRYGFAMTVNVPEELRVDPCFHELVSGEESHEVRSVRVTVCEGAAEARIQAKISFLDDLASATWAALVADGHATHEVRDGNAVSPTARVVARPRQRTASVEDHGAFTLSGTLQPLPVRSGNLSEIIRRAPLHGTLYEGDLETIFARPVIEQIDAIKREAHDVEVGGLLLGHLASDRELERDSDLFDPELFVVVTAQVQAKHTEAEAMRLLFTEETWRAADAAIALRGRDEIIVGWYHTHPARTWCANCAPDKWAHCPFTRDFFSAPDRDVHRAVAPKAYGVALVAGDRPDENHQWQDRHALFGWRHAEIVPRGFRIVDDPTSLDEAIAQRSPLEGRLLSSPPGPPPTPNPSGD